MIFYFKIFKKKACKRKTSNIPLNHRKVEVSRTGLSKTPLGLAKNRDQLRD